MRAYSRSPPTDLHHHRCSINQKVTGRRHHGRSKGLPGPSDVPSRANKPPKEAEKIGEAKNGVNVLVVYRARAIEKAAIGGNDPSGKAMEGREQSVVTAYQLPHARRRLSGVSRIRRHAVQYPSSKRREETREPPHRAAEGRTEPTVRLFWTPPLHSQDIARPVKVGDPGTVNAQTPDPGVAHSRCTVCNPIHNGGRSERSPGRQGGRWNLQPPTQENSSVSSPPFSVLSSAGLARASGSRPIPAAGPVAGSGSAMAAGTSPCAAN